MPYNRLQAVQYAAFWWGGFNPLFRAFSDDCTNFISQCLLAGGMPMEVTGRRDKGWWYLGPAEQWSYSWAVAHSLRWYMETSGRAERREEARQLELGDIIAYDWDGDGNWQHNTIVVGFDLEGEPLVAAHTAAAWGRPWRYTDSPAYTSRTKYLFWHIKLP
ncbi:MAG TPA: amidase domain-containing protein [Symbiobacteriaceae bacterium]|nr:amidase domain-containing protein [Symbiobacteriaceae bacterium]